MPDLPELLEVADLVDRYGFHNDVVRRWLNSGELAGFKIGKRWFTTPEDWQAFIDARRGVAS
jgi:Helix-turn-helix domain